MVKTTAPVGVFDETGLERLRQFFPAHLLGSLRTRPGGKQPGLLETTDPGWTSNVGCYTPFLHMGR